MCVCCDIVFIGQMPLYGEENGLKDRARQRGTAQSKSRTKKENLRQLRKGKEEDGKASQGRTILERVE